MDGIILPDTQIDSDIAIVRSQIEALRHRRSLLSHTLLSSRNFKQRLELEKSRSGTPHSAVQSVSEVAEEHASTSTSNLYRTCSGITAFRIQDPDPNAVDSGNVIGVRFEIFSNEQRAFQTPYYILLNHPRPGSQQLKVHKHTIPPYIPLQPLISKYLPYARDDDAAQGEQAQNLPRLVRALRRELVAHHKRLEAYASLKRDLGNRHGVEEVKMLDASGRELEIQFAGKITARIRVGVDGKVEKTAVGPTKAVHAEEIEAAASKLCRKIRGFIEEGDGRVGGLVERIKSMPRS